MSRTANSVRNVKYAIIGQTVGLVITFIARRVFVDVLGSEYLGLSGLFTNILSMLSLAELGLGSAITFTLYKYLAEGDQEKIKSYMLVFRKLYTIIAIVILLTGLIISPFIKFFIGTEISVNNTELIFILFLLNTVFSYLLIYKRTLIIADQKRYLATLYRYSFFFLMSVTQIFVLYATKNIYLFLTIQILSTILENIFISLKADKLYPYIKCRVAENLDSDEKKNLRNNVGAMFSHKLGGVVVSGTDNLLISKFVGIVTVGIYSNYILIITALNSFISIIFQSVIPSIGNLNVTSNSENKIVVFNKLMFLGNWIITFSSIGFYFLVTPFIRMWLSSFYNLSIITVGLISINFYLSGMRQPLLATRDAMGLFWKDRYKPIIESILNIIFSVILGYFWGINGIILGTIITNITVCLSVEPFIIYKYGLNTSVLQYYKKYVQNIIILGLNVLIIMSLFSYFSNYSIFFSVLIVLLVPNIVYIIIYWRSNEFKFYFKLLMNILKKTISRKGEV